MRPIGFSTGALAEGNFARGLDLQRGSDGITAAELSALPDHELPALVNALASPDLDVLRTSRVTRQQAPDAPREERLRPSAVSEVGVRGESLPTGATTRLAFADVAHRVPADCPLIVESVIPPEGMERELNAVEGVRRQVAVASRAPPDRRPAAGAVLSDIGQCVRKRTASFA